MVKHSEWWRQAVVYQIYPRSFADANGDGIGDLRGIISRVPYLRQLGIDAVWLSPFYPSPLADGGYDVADYRNVDPRLGTLADFNDMVAAFHNADIRVIVDIVPNHSSDQHPWFQQALASEKGSAARDRYIFRDGLGRHGELPPADWRSIFGGPSWHRTPDGQWYLHTFAKEQPDFNWANPEVTADFIETIEFWADRGVDGFRVDVADNLKKDLSQQPLPTWKQINDPKLWQVGKHPFRDRDEVAEVYREWRQIFDRYDPPLFAVAEAWVKPDRAHRYAANTSLGQVFNFDLLNANFSAAEFRTIIDRNIANAATAGSSNTWVLSNHDVVRHATRYGLPYDKSHDRQVARLWDLQGGQTIPLDAAQGLRRARAATMLLLALPGSTYLYQGEELGLPSITDIPASQRQDPAFFRNPEYEVGRDGCRIPIPWVSDAPSFGFGPTSASHMPQPDSWRDFAVDVETADPNSTLNLYRAALALRRQLLGRENASAGEQDAARPSVETPSLAAETDGLVWLDDESPNPDVLIFARATPSGDTWVCATNFGNRPVPMPSGIVLLSSHAEIAGQARNAGPGTAELAGETTVWLIRPHN